MVKRQPPTACGPRLLVLGAGRLGTFHLQKLRQNKQLGWLGVVETHPARLQAAMQRFEIDGSHTLATFMGQCDAVVIATPTTSHASLASYCLQHKLHVLVEKPLADTCTAASALIRLAAQQQCLLQVGHVERFNPAVTLLLQKATAPRYIVAERLGPFSGRSTDVDVVMDLMIHDLDLLNAFTAAPLCEVRATGMAVLSTEVDMVAARLEFADATVAQLSAGRTSLLASRKLRVFTETAYFSVDCLQRSLKCVRRLPSAQPAAASQMTVEPLEVPPGDALQLQDEAFVAALLQLRRGAKLPPLQVDGQAGLRAMQLAEAVQAALLQQSLRLQAAAGRRAAL